MMWLKRLAILGVLAIASLFSPALTISAASDAGDVSFTNMHAAVERSYRRTKLRGPKEERHSQARGRAIRVTDQNHLGMNGVLEYYLLTEKDKDTGLISSEIIIGMKAAETLERDSSALAYIRRDNSGYRWTSYSVQYQAGDTVKELSSQPKETETGVLRQGKKLAIPLGTSHLSAPLRHGSGIFVSLHSETAPPLRVKIPFSYLVGYIAKASEHGLIDADHAALAQRLRAAIKAKSKM